MIDQNNLSTQQICKVLHRLQVFTTLIPELKAIKVKLLKVRFYSDSKYCDASSLEAINSLDTLMPTWRRWLSDE